MVTTSSTTRRLVLGCIADDVTGATDIATNLVAGGLKVMQVFGVNGLSALHTETDADAVVIALKSRSLPRQEAIRQSLDALHALQKRRARRIYFKYCSTFDSTIDGNIGPVSEALMSELEVGQTIYCPAFPDAERTVYNGHLFVGRQLLHESPLKDHPLTPMTDSDIVRFLNHQVSGSVGLLPHDVVSRGNGPIQSTLFELAKLGRQHVVVDACNNQQLRSIAAVASRMTFVTGGSGLAKFLPEGYLSSGLLTRLSTTSPMPQVSGRSAVIAGSCSSATNVQVNEIKNRVPTWEIDVTAAMKSRDAELKRLQEWVSELDRTQPLLISSTASPHRVTQLQATFGVEAVAHGIEEFLSLSAQMLASEFDVRRFVIAGGETSGAVTRALGVEAVRIGPNICPGVPWTETVGRTQPIALALKSGNFGDSDFFAQALEMLP